MPWEISIINGTAEHPKPLGSREEVIAAFAESLPGVLLQRRPAPPAEILDQLPPLLREAMMRASRAAAPHLRLSEAVSQGKEPGFSKKLGFCLLRGVL